MRIIGGEARGRPIRTPAGRETRPALDRVRESVFAILGERLEGASVLDLFAGSGGFGLEAVSRGAHRVVFVERDPAALKVLERNIRDLGFGGRAEVVKGDALRRSSAEGPYDVIFIDPPFALFDAPEETRRIAERVEALQTAHLRPGGVILLRLPAGRELPALAPPADRRTFGASTILFFELP